MNNASGMKREKAKQPSDYQYNSNDIKKISHKKRFKINKKPTLARIIRIKPVYPLT